MPGHYGCDTVSRGYLMDLGRIGVWWSGSWRAAGDSELDVAAELESLGYGAIWSSGGFDPGFSPTFGRLLASTRQIAVASGIVSMWAGAPADVGPAVADLEARFPGRFLLGIGASHSAIVRGDYSAAPIPTWWPTSMRSMRSRTPGDSTEERRALAALGNRMLELAAERAVGAHPYFVPVEHTTRARSVLGSGPLLAPEVAVVLETDPAAARALAREYASIYLGLPNYTQNLRTFGFDDGDIDGGGSDRLIDAVIPWGDTATIADRIHEHHEAGADHVCIQVISESGRDGFPLAEYRELAGALLGG